MAAQRPVTTHPGGSLADFFNQEVLPLLTADLVFTDPSHRFQKDSDKWRGGCPRHQSKSGTSFVVTPSTLDWFCAGCDNVGGGPLQYLHWLRTGSVDVKGPDFVDLVKELAALVGLEVPAPELTQEQQEAANLRAARRTVLAGVIRAARLALATDEAADARAYLAERGFGPDDVEALQIGFYPDVAGIQAALKREGQDLKLAGQMGVLNPAWAGFLVFPWFDAHGLPLTLYAKWQRKVPPLMREHPGWERKRNESHAEWVKLSPAAKERVPWEEPRVTKTLALPGDGTKAAPMYLHLARKAGEKDLIFVEGVTDAALAQVRGDTRVVACVAAHLSKLQIQTLQRCGIQSVTLCLDPDSVGQKNLASNLVRLEEAGIAGYVAPQLPDGMDPDEFILARGIDAWRAHVGEALHAYRYHAELILTKHRGAGEWTDSTRKRALDEAAGFRNKRLPAGEGDLKAFFFPVIKEGAGVDLHGKNGTPKKPSLVPTGITAAELQRKILPPPKWIVQEILTEGLGFLVGKPKQGKSWIALQIAIAVAYGGVALGKIPVEQGRVLYLGLEDTQRRLQSRMGHLIEDSAWPEALHLFTVWPRLDDGGGEAFREWFGQYPDTRLVIVDTLAKIRKPSSSNSNTYQEEYEALGSLKAIADGRGCTFLMVHHVRKMAADDPLDTISGTQAIAGAADTLMLLQRVRGQSTADLYVTGRDVDEAKYALQWNNETIWTLEGDAATFHRTQEQAEILQALTRFSGPVKIGALIDEVVERFGGTNPGVRKRIQRMADRGQLASSNGLYWRPVPDHQGGVRSVPVSQEDSATHATLGNLQNNGADFSDRSVEGCPNLYEKNRTPGTGGTGGTPGTGGTRNEEVELEL